MSSAIKKRAGSNYCCVVGCHKNEGTDRPEVRFFGFPTRDTEQRKLWIKAVNRKNKDNSLWQPSKHSKICSEHFLGKEWSRTRGHPDYVPSVFPTKHVKEKSASGEAYFHSFLFVRQNNNWHILLLL